jgi:transcription elongation factor Elf1
MADDTQGGTDEIKSTDIVFDCPHCGKSLAIDYRGAGLTIPCSDCGQSVAVPILEGMELADFDSTDEEQEMQIVHLRRALATSEEHVKTLEADMSELSARRTELEKGRQRSMSVLSAVSKEMEELVQSLERVTAAVGRMQQALRK